MTGRQGASSYTVADSDWGGNVREWKSTSGGCSSIGVRCITAWSCSQGAYALSSAEAELYAMVEAVSRAKGLRSIARELGYRSLSETVVLGAVP